MCVHGNMLFVSVCVCCLGVCLCSVYLGISGGVIVCICWFVLVSVRICVCFVCLYVYV